MANFLGILALVGAFIATIFVTRGRPKLMGVLLVAVFLRSSAALFHFYVAPLPDGTTDAVTFERVAWDISRAGIESIVANFDYSAAYIYSALMAVPYAVLGRSSLMLQAFSVFIGTFCVYLSWTLAKNVWDDESSANAAAWLTALFPTLIMYAALTMREVYFIAFLLMALILTAQWARNMRFWTAAGAAVLYGTAAVFHPASLAGLAVLGTLVLFHAITRLLSTLHRSALHWPSLLIIALACGTIGMVAVLNPPIPKVGSYVDLFNAETYLDVLDNRVRGSAAYPAWLEPDGVFDLLWIVPVRAVYLLFSPFLWDVQSASHIVGVFDASLYMALVAAVLLNFNRLRRNPAAVAVLLVLVATIIVLGIGTGNFGAALRHRAKIVMIIAVLAAPALLRFLRYRPRDLASI